MITCILDHKMFNQLFKPTEKQPDPWKRIAAYQYEIEYDMVTDEQRNEMKQLYYMYLYSAPAEKLSAILGDTV